MSLNVRAVRFADRVRVYVMEASRNGAPFGRPVEMATPATAARYLYAPNAEPVVKRKTGEVVQINLYPESDDSELPSFAGSAGAIYEEHLGGHHKLTMLKRVGEAGELVRWSDEDGFPRSRFNADLVETSAVRALSEARTNRSSW